MDDLPIATNDPGGTVTEDVAGSLSGNVLSNDTSGADTSKSFVSWGADSAAITALNSYGTLVQNTTTGDWSYVLNNNLATTQALTAGSNTTYTLNYTMQDADGDQSPAQLSITIKGADDGASVVTAAASGPDATVYESGLNPNGSNATAPTETTSGSFTVSANDGIQDMVIGTTTFTLAQMQAFATTNGSVNTAEGLLTLTSYSGSAFSGTVNYSYTLSATIDNVNHALTGNDTKDLTGFNDSVALTVHGVGGTTASDNLVIRAVDDLPIATNDTGGTVTEDVAGSLSGNVLSNDTSGADTSKSFVSWGADSAAITALNSYGTLVQNTTTGDWSYVLNNNLATTQALTAASNTTYTLNYTMQDADGDTSAAQLSITIKGANDTRGVTVQEAGGAGSTVYETALVDGRNELSNPALNSDAREVVSGSFSVSATDGIASVSVGGTSFALSALKGFTTGSPSTTISTGEGALVINGYSSSDGDKTATISYTYTLTDNIVSPPASTTFVDDIDNLVTVTGVSGVTSVSADLQIRIMDDTPLALNDTGGTVTEDVAGSLSGNVLSNDTSGADTSKSFVSWGADSAAITALNSYGTLVQNTTTGDWSYVLNNNLATTQALTAGSNTTYTLNYTMQDADGDQSPAQLSITIKGADDGASVVTAAASGPDATVLEHGLTSVLDTTETTSGSFTVSTNDGILNLVIGGTTFTLAQMQAFATTNGSVNTGEGVLTLTSYSGSVFSGTVNYSYTLSATIDNDSKAGATGTYFDDSVTLTVNGLGGTTASDNLVVRAVDDTPTATLNSNSVNEGALLTVNAAGGVLTNDTAGADGFAAAGGVVGVRAAGSDTTTQVATGVGSSIVGLHGTLTLAGDGSYTYQSSANNISGADTDVFVYTIKDGDGDLSTTTLTINVINTILVATNDDITVNEAALATGSNPSSTDETAGGTLVGNVTGGTGSYTYALTSPTTGSFGTMTLNANGTYSYTLSSPVDGANANNGITTENNRDTFTYQATDGNGNTVTNTITADIIDDVPIVTASASLIASSGTAAIETGVFNYTLGADQLTYSGNPVSDFVDMALTGKVGGLAISSPSIALQSESATASDFDFGFTYANGPSSTTTASGVLHFDKVAGTYSVEMAAPLVFSLVLTTSGTLDRVFYDHAGDQSPSNTNTPDVVVSQLSNNFFVQFTGGNGTFTAGADAVLTPPEVISATTTWVSVSNASNGVAGDTIGKSEVLDMDFFTSNPGSNVAASPTALLSGMFLKFDNIGNTEDIVVVLKLVSGDGTLHTTMTLIVGDEDIYKAGASIPTGYNISLDNNDGAVIIESNDFNFGGSNWFIQGAQVISTTENLTGNAYALNGATGATGGASDLTSVVSLGGATLDQDVIKITDIGFVTTATTSQVGDLNFTFAVRDGDGDRTASQTLNAMLIDGQFFTGDGSSNNLTGTAASDLLSGGLGNDTLTGGLSSDIFKWNLGETGDDLVTDFKVGLHGDVLDLRDLLQGEHATAASLNAFLDFSANGSGQTVVSVHPAGSGGVAQTVTLGNVQYGDLQTLAGGTTDIAIITKLLADGNLKTDV